jgi:hypothetical protein
MCAYLLLVVFLFSLDARADLRWDSTRIELHPSMADQDVKGDFAFINTGDQPVTIDSVEPGCGCTTIALGKPTYRPGERGHIEAIFHIGERTGIQDKPIRVKIHGVKEPVILTLTTYIPEVLRVEPQDVFWRAGDAPIPRIIKLTAAPEERLAEIHVMSTNPKFRATLQTIHKGSDYLVVVAPLDTSSEATTTLYIEAMAGPGVLKKFHAVANIAPN